MCSRSLSPLEAIRFSWNTLKGNFLFFLFISAIISAATYLPEAAIALQPRLAARGIMLPLGSGDLPISIFITLPIFITGIALIAVSSVELVLMKIALSFYDNQGLEFSDITRALTAIPSYLIASALFLLIVAFGLVFLILPGVYLFLKYQFYGYFIADRRMGPFNALKQSARITDGLKRRLLAFWLVLYLMIFAIASLLAVSISVSAGYAVKFVQEAFMHLFYIGLDLILLISALVIFIPLTKLGTAYIYRTLERQQRAAFTRSGFGRTSGPSGRSFGKL